MKQLYALKKILLLSGDAFIYFLSLLLTLIARYQSWPEYSVWWLHFWPFFFMFFAWFVIFYIFNLYDFKINQEKRKFFQLSFKAFFLNSAISIAFFYLIPQIIAPKTNLLIFIAIFYLLFFGWRKLFYYTLKAYLPRYNIAFIGYSQEVNELINELEEKSYLGYQPIFILDPQYDGTLLKAYREFGELPQLVKEHRITSLVVSADPGKSEALRASLFACLPLKINYLHLSQFYETITGKIPVNAIDQIWFFENLTEANKKTFDKLKNIADLFLASFLLATTIVFWPLIALIIKLESKGPAFFKQERSGKDGKIFTIYKFRTMKEDGNNRELTQEKDSRITGFGDFLRKTRIDELPQIINILKGEMSFIGPRPERPELIVELESKIPFYRERMLVKPGITGWDQISGEYHSPSYEDTLKKLQYDLFYIKNRSSYLDLSIALKTIYTMISKAGR